MREDCGQVQAIIQLGTWTQFTKDTPRSATSEQPHPGDRNHNTESPPGPEGFPQWLPENTKGEGSIKSTHCFLGNQKREKQFPHFLGFWHGLDDMKPLRLVARKSIVSSLKVFIR